MDREEMLQTEAKCKAWLDNKIKIMDELVDMFRNSYTGYSRYTPLLVLYCIFWGAAGVALGIMSPWIGRWVAGLCRVGAGEGDKLLITLFIVSLYGIATVILLYTVQMVTRVCRIRRIDAHVKNVSAIKKDLTEKRSRITSALESIGQTAKEQDYVIQDFGKKIAEIELIETIARKYKQEDSQLLKKSINVLYWVTFIFFEIMILFMTTKTVAGTVYLEMVDMDWKWGASIGTTGYSFLYVLVIGSGTVALCYLWEKIKKHNVSTYIKLIGAMQLLIPVSFILMPTIVYLIAWGIIALIGYGIYKVVKEFW